MKKKLKLHALPTDSLDSMLLKADSGKWFFEKVNSQEVAEVVQPYYLNLTSDEAIKKDETGWVIYKEILLELKEGDTELYTHGRKIVATDNPNLLIASGFNADAINYEQLPKIPTSLIEYFVEKQGIWEINVDVEQYIDFRRLKSPSDKLCSCRGNEHVIGECELTVSVYKLNSSGEIIWSPGDEDTRE